jgi:hypothetical protein
MEKKQKTLQKRLGESVLSAIKLKDKTLASQYYFQYISFVNGVPDKFKDYELLNKVDREFKTYSSQS